MPRRESEAARIERGLARGDYQEVLKAAADLLGKAPSSFLGRKARAAARLATGDFIGAEQDIRIALSASPSDPQARMTRAALDARLGLTDAALEAYRDLAIRGGREALEAQMGVLITLHGAGRNEEFLREVREDGPWRSDPRAALMHARAAAIEDTDRGIEALRAVFESAWPAMVRRWAGFEAVGLLDRTRRFREAFDLATRVHAATTGMVDLDPWILPARMQLAHFEREAPWYEPRAPRVDGVAFLVSMPRSGTTLLEQMLDRHPRIAGIGEFDGLDHVCRTLWDSGQWPWPSRPRDVPDAVFSGLQERYLDGARRIAKPGASWTFDKSLRGWRALPEIATVFPGAACIDIQRDPRDMAVSIHLSYFNPHAYEWTSDLAAVRAVIEMQRRVVTRGLEVLALPHVRIAYEDLVEDPGEFAGRCLKLMGLPPDPSVSSPEGNAKAAFTLSQAQVRRPINRGSIGRWKNYEWAFDGSWDGLVAEHEGRRERR
jgi:hypothetical protein